MVRWRGGGAAAAARCASARDAASACWSMRSSSFSSGLPATPSDGCGLGGGGGAGGCAVVCSRRRLIARLTSPADDCSAMVACSSVKPIATSDETAPSSIVLAFSGLLGSASSRQLHRYTTIARRRSLRVRDASTREAGRTHCQFGRLGPNYFGQMPKPTRRRLGEIPRVQDFTCGIWESHIMGAEMPIDHGWRC